MIFDDWSNGKEISQRLVKINKRNITANFFLLVESFLEKKQFSSSILTDSQNQFLDKNFLELF